MKRVIISVLLAVLFGTSTSYSQLIDFFAIPEGVEIATSAAAGAGGVPNPQLVSVVTINTEYDLAVYGQVRLEFLFEGSEVGKSNLWIYTFVSADDATVTASIGVIKLAGIGMMLPLTGFETLLENFSFTIPAFSSAHPLNLTHLATGEEFARKVVENQYYSEQQGICPMLEAQGTPCSYIIGVATVATEYHCMPSEETGWFKILRTDNAIGRYDEYCCFAPYDDVNSLNCSKRYIGIAEMEEAISIQVFPNPATTTVTISNPDEYLISGISIYDVLGNRIFEIAADAREINISNLPAGNYYIGFTVGSRKFYRSLIIV